MIKVRHPELVSSLTMVGNGDWDHSLGVVDMLSPKGVGCTHRKLYGRDVHARASAANHLHVANCGPTAATHFTMGKILRSRGPPPWFQSLSPPPLIIGHLGQRCCGLLSPGTALLSNPAGPVLWFLQSFSPHSNFYAWL